MGHAGIIDEHLNGTGLLNPFQLQGGLSAIRHVKACGIGAAAAGADGLCDGVGPLRMTVAMNDDVQALRGKLPADRRADHSASAGDERPLHDVQAGPLSRVGDTDDMSVSVRETNTETRPLSSSCVPERIVKRYIHPPVASPVALLVGLFE